MLDYTGDEKRCIERVLKKHGMTASADIFALYYGINDWQHFSLGNISAKTVITDHFSRMLQGFRLTPEEITVMVDEFYKEMLSSHRLKYGARKLLNGLKEKGYKLYITSNGYSDFQRRRIKDAKIEQYFEDIFISEEIDLRKPGKAYFKYVIDRIPESKLQNILLVGDAPTTDVLGGLNIGIHTCWLNDKGRKTKFRYTYQIKSLAELSRLLSC